MTTQTPGRTEASAPMPGHEIQAEETPMSPLKCLYRLTAETDVRDAGLCGGPYPANLCCLGCKRSDEQTFAAVLTYLEVP